MSSNMCEGGGKGRRCDEREERKSRRCENVKDQLRVYKAKLSIVWQYDV